eukprot:UN15230
MINPDSTMVEISAMMGKMWSETNEKARAPFVTAMEKSKANYEKIDSVGTKVQDITTKKT